MLEKEKEGGRKEINHKPEEFYGGKLNGGGPGDTRFLPHSKVYKVSLKLDNTLLNSGFVPCFSLLTTNHMNMKCAGSHWLHQCSMRRNIHFTEVTQDFTLVFFKNLLISVAVL